MTPLRSVKLYQMQLEFDVIVGTLYSLVHVCRKSPSCRIKA